MESLSGFFRFRDAQKWNPTFARETEKWIGETIRHVQPMAGLLGRAYADTARRFDYVKANHELREATQKLMIHDLNLSWTDEELCAWCERKAEKAVPWMRAAEGTDSESTLLGLIITARSHMERYGMEAPDVGKYGPLGLLRRVADAKCWRLKARQLQAAKVEELAILLGRVRKGAEIYCSDDTVRRRSNQRFRNRKYLENTEAENQDGQRYTLAQLADLSNSNPYIRRVELMVRIRGFDEVAQLLGHVREFWTFTTPSRFHRWTTVGKNRLMRPNPKWDGSMPRDAQDWQCENWARIRAALARRGVRLYGFRVVEAHHDGTPHWHLAMFFSPHWKRPTAWDDDGNVTEWEDDETRAAAPRVRALVRRYSTTEEKKAFRVGLFKEIRAEKACVKACAKTLTAKKKVTPRAAKATAHYEALMQETQTKLALASACRKERRKLARLLGEAKEHRCDFKEIDPEKGDAAGYLAKYITKAIAADDAGDLVQKDLYGYDNGNSATRVDAWAYANRNRQFQQIGGPSVTAWREMRKAMAGDITQADLFDAPRPVQLAAEAADESDWQAFVLLMGGPMVKRDAQLVRVGYWHEHTADGEVVGAPFNRYGEPAESRVYGLSYDEGNGHIFTRVHSWKVGPVVIDVPAIENTRNIEQETHDAMRHMDADTTLERWAPWAAIHDFERLAAQGLLFSGAHAPPLEFCQ